MNKFFHNEATGLNADIKRHKKIQRELKEKIACLESKDILTKVDKVILETYKKFLCQLMNSYDQVASKIGKKN